VGFNGSVSITRRTTARRCRSGADALSDPAQAVLVVDLRTDVAPFRCLPRAVAEISSNQSISNVDLSEFAGSVGPSGVFRGFWEDPPGAAPEVANTL